MDPSQTDMHGLQSDIAQMRIDQPNSGLDIQASSSTDHHPAEQLASSNSNYQERGSIQITPKSSADSSRRKHRAKKSPRPNLKENLSPSLCPNQVLSDQLASIAAPTCSLAAGNMTAKASGSSITTPMRYPQTNNSVRPKSILRRKKQDTPFSQAPVTDGSKDNYAVRPMPAFSFNTPNAPSNSPSSKRKGIASRAHSTPIDSTAVPTPRTGKVKFDANTNFEISADQKIKKIASVVRQSVHIFHECSERWRQLKKTGATELDAIVGYKMDAQGRIARTVSFVAVAHMVEMTSLLKEMDNMATDMRIAVLEVANVDIKETEFADVRPFKKLSLLKIMAMMNHLAKSYRADFTYRKKTCAEVSQACSYETPVERCVVVFSNTKSRWALEPNFDKNDVYLDALVAEIGSLDAKT